MTINDAMAILKKKGFKMTQRRKDILQFFWEAEGSRTAKELYEHMEAIYEGISFDTVYRNLHLYHDLSILESTELNSERHFWMNCGADHHHHHFICNDCGSTKKINLCPMDEAETLLDNYKILDHKFEVYGLCPNCQSV